MYNMGRILLYCKVSYMKNKLFLTLLVPNLAFAIDVGDVSNFIYSDQEVLTKEIINTVDTARLVTLKVRKINSPKEKGEYIDFDSPDEILSTPAAILLPSKARENFRVFYQGPADDKERYYKLIWQDLPIQKQEQNSNNSGTTATASASAQIGTILVVAPRVERFSYTYKNNTVVNTGNSSFRLIGYGACPIELQKTQEVCQERYNVMPGDSIKLKYVDFSQTKSYAGIWHKEQFIPLKEDK